MVGNVNEWLREREGDKGWIKGGSFQRGKLIAEWGQKVAEKVNFPKEDIGFRWVMETEGKVPCPPRR